VCSRNALYKSTFYLLTYLLVYMILCYNVVIAFSSKFESTGDVKRGRIRCWSLGINIYILEHLALDL